MSDDVGPIRQISMIMIA